MCNKNGMKAAYKFGTSTANECQDSLIQIRSYRFVSPYNEQIERKNGKTEHSGERGKED